MSAAHASKAKGQRVWKTQPLGGESGARDFSGARRGAARCGGSGTGTAAEERAPVGMARRVRASRGGSDLDDAAEIHHRDAVADVPHDREIVRDEQDREAELALQVAQQVEDLRLDRDVERGDRLVGTMNSGSSASARAMPMRWRWPPENSCG